MPDHLKGTPAHTAEGELRREVILALLEERPYSTAQLAIALEVHNGIASMLCQQLVRAGTIQRLTDWTWALPGGRKGDAWSNARALSRSAVDGLKDLTPAKIIRTLEQHGPQPVRTLAQLLHVNHWTLRDRLAFLKTQGAVTMVGRGRSTVVQRGMAKVPATPHERVVGDVDRALAAVRRSAPAPAAVPLPVTGTTRIIDGQEYEVVFDGRQSITGDWPDGGSSLSGSDFEVKR